MLSTITVGYRYDEGAVIVIMYYGDTLLNCFSAEDNKLAWT